jgi:hypothetical protein
MLGGEVTGDFYVFETDVSYRHRHRADELRQNEHNKGDD